MQYTPQLLSVDSDFSGLGWELSFLLLEDSGQVTRSLNVNLKKSKSELVLSCLYK